MADIRLKQLEDQLKRIGCNYRFWGRAELKELAFVLLPGETVEHCVNGSYEGGFALLAATDQRVLLIDKKPMYLTLEDIRFDMITEIDFNHRLMNANVRICTPNKSLRFVAYNHARLRSFFHFVQTRVAEIRQHYTQLQYGQINEQHEAQNAANQQRPIHEQFQAAPAVTHQFESSEPQQELPGTRTRKPKIIQAMQYRHTVPAISAYTRLPLMSRQRRFLGSRAMNSPQPSSYR
ncbi:PH domain-containing protein [Aeromicrobium sp.]|nr:PH domain-containing protein [Candidatus Saccharibacteria bacterium]